MHSLIGEYDSRWCFSYLPKRAPRSKGLLTVLPKPISLPKPITLDLLCIFVTTSLLKIRISLWWMLNKTTLLSHILLTFNKLLCKFVQKINVTESLTLARHSLGWVEAGGWRGGETGKPTISVFPHLRDPHLHVNLCQFVRLLLFRGQDVRLTHLLVGPTASGFCGEKNGKDSLLN